MEVDVSVKIETIGDSDVELEPLVTYGVSPCLDDTRFNDVTSDVKLESISGSPFETTFSVQVIKEELDAPESALQVHVKNENAVYLQSGRTHNDMDEYIDIGETEIVYPKRSQPGEELNATLRVSPEDETRKHVSNNFKCNDCDFNSKNKIKLQTHVAIHLKGKRHKKTPRLKRHGQEKSVKCELCGYKFSHAPSLKRHMITHTGEKPYKCKMCNFRCNISNYIEIHMRRHTGEKPFKCDICDHRFIQKSSLRRHLRCKHSNNEVQEKCKICNYSCTKNDYMKVHMMTHTGEKPHQCDICDYSCIQKGSLTQHLRVHTGEKPYKCDMCVYKGSTLSILRRHLATHKGKQPFKCDRCDYKTMKRKHFKNHIKNHEKDIEAGIDSDLKQHLSTRKGNQLFKCEACDYKTMKRIDLKNHMITHEEDIEVDIM